MKKYTLIIAAVCFTLSLHAQAASSDSIPFIPKKKSASDEKLIIDINLDNWLNIPDSIKTKTFRSRGMNLYFMKDMPFGASPFSFGIGLGISSHNVHSNAAVTYSGDTTFLSPVSSSISYDLNKLSINYLDIPLELRFRTKGNTKFKWALGFKAGYLINSHTKYRDKEGKIKVYDIDNLMKYRYGVSTRIGIGQINLTGFYSLSPLFTGGMGPDVIPYSFGISLTY